jgi:branched-chain amino acid transport system ATP-binding protein
LLKVTELYAGYGNLQVLNGVSMEAAPGEVTVIVGPNGSGKSTLLKTIAGLTTIYQGTVTLDGRVLSGLASHQIARSGIAYLPQTESVFTNLSVAENLKLAGYTVNQNDYETRVREALETFPALSAYFKTKTANLSGGERQMVAMSMALIRKPTVIMFDEPTANLAPKIATQVLSTIVSLGKAAGMTVLLVEQNSRRALEIGDTAYLLVSGEVAFKGSARGLLEHKELAKLYLGLRTAA